MIRKESLSEILKSQGISVSEDILQKEIENPELNKQINEIKKEYSFKNWDKKSPINGVDENSVLASIPSAKNAPSVYLILKDEEVIVIQPCEDMPEGVADIAKKHIEQIAEDIVMWEIILRLSQQHSEKAREMTLKDVQKEIEILKGSIIEITSAVMGGDE